ncbi:MAG: ABC transporter ATP-binding protein [Armatimonadota bacterium]
MGFVRLVNLTRTFDEVTAVDGLDLEIREREFLVLVGPSGCGKTTVLRMIAGLQEPTAGEIWIGDRMVNDVSPRDRDIAMVFQNYALYPHMTVAENLSFGLRLRKMPRDEIASRVQQTAQMLQIDGLLDRLPGELSGGQRQRVALGRAVIREPVCFLMDEPLSNLDAKLRVQTRAELIRLHRRLGITTIYVTHDQVEAMTMGDRIAVMCDGRLQQVGPPADVYQTPENMFVAGFIGSPPMNFLTVRVHDDGRDIHLAGEGFDLHLAQPPENAGEYLGEKVVVGIRPTDLKLAEDPAEACAIEATLVVPEPTGAETVLYLDLGAESLVASVDTDTQFEEGQRLRLAVDMSSVHLFDPSSEKRIT